MKRLIMVFAIVGACTTVAVAQDSSATSNKNSDKMGAHQAKDYVVIKDGKTMLMKGNSLTALTSDITLTNGTVVKTDGSVKASDGTTMKLQEGEKIDVDGKLIKKDQPDGSKPQK